MKDIYTSQFKIFLEEDSKLSVISAGFRIFLGILVHIFTVYLSETEKVVRKFFRIQSI